MTPNNDQEKQEIDIHRLELRYSHIRVYDPSRIRRLANSISSHGQLKPLVAVTCNKDHLILIDGYQRQAALTYLGKDTAQVLIMNCSEDQALFQLLIKRGERHWQAIEEAGIIQELYRRFDCSFGSSGKFREVPWKFRGQYMQPCIFFSFYYPFHIVRIARVICPGIPHYITQRGNAVGDGFNVPEASTRESLW